MDAWISEFNKLVTLLEEKGIDLEIISFISMYKYFHSHAIGEPTKYCSQPTFYGSNPDLNMSKVQRFGELNDHELTWLHDCSVDQLKWINNEYYVTVQELINNKEFLRRLACIREIHIHQRNLFKIIKSYEELDEFAKLIPSCDNLTISNADMDLDDMKIVMKSELYSQLNKFCMTSARKILRKQCDLKTLSFTCARHLFQSGKTLWSIEKISNFTVARVITILVKAKLKFPDLRLVPS
ncbi:unnamed protein product [Moneuplotes crassus]|uniref:Uncharacterized protein n=1 Tax=Euplotes crassus TaxID=5936 RepID=A0AAD2DBU9_EUPCR|nr:unnamed protein product [Moneuplotes crassus]